MQELSQKIAVVTGGASGIGFGMAQAFGARGMKLVLADVEAEPLERAVALLVSAGAEVIGVECDVSDAAAVENLRDRALSQFGAASRASCVTPSSGGRSSIWISLPEAITVSQRHVFSSCRPLPGQSRPVR